MNLKIKNNGLLITAVVIMLAWANYAHAQTDAVRKQRLRSPVAIARGFIGGESHDSYVIRARRGQMMTVRISWRREADNTANFSVATGRNFFNSEAVNFGRQSNGGRTWTGRIPATRDYYIYVTAHPTARYTLRITIK